MPVSLSECTAGSAQLRTWESSGPGISAMFRALDETGPPPDPCRPDLRATRSVTRKFRDAQPPFVESTKVSLRQCRRCSRCQRRRRTGYVRYTPSGHVLVSRADGEALAAGRPEADGLPDAPVLPRRPAGAGRKLDGRSGCEGLALGNELRTRRNGILGRNRRCGQNDGGNQESRAAHGASLAPTGLASNGEATVREVDQRVFRPAIM